MCPLAEVSLNCLLIAVNDRGCVKSPSAEIQVGNY
jgi:hypothetical protein